MKARTISTAKDIGLRSERGNERRGPKERSAEHPRLSLASKPLSAVDAVTSASELVQEGRSVAKVSSKFFNESDDAVLSDSKTRASSVSYIEEN